MASKTNEGFTERFNVLLDDLQKMGLTRDDFAKKVGVSKQTVSSWASGVRSPTRPTIIGIARTFGLRIEWLHGWDVPKYAIQLDAENLSVVPSFRTVPLVGEIACGDPILAMENITDQIPLPEYIKADFCLTCKGDSMVDARINDGDLVFIRQQDDVLDGEIAAVLIDDVATLKRVRKYPGMVILRAANAKYEDIVLGGPGESREIRIIGKAVFFLSSVQ